MEDYTFNKKGQMCPISKSICTGTCVYSYILENIDVGIVILDIKAKEVAVQNRSSREIFYPDKKPKDYNAITKLLLPNISECLDSKKPSPQKTIKFHDKILGYSTYHIRDKYLWLFIKDITNKARLESIAEAVVTMNNIGYVFAGIRHEISNPLNSLKMTMTVLRQDIDEYDKKTMREYFDLSLQSISRIEYLLSSLKNFNMYEDLTIRKIKMHYFMKNLMAVVENDFQDKGINIITMFQSEAECGLIDPRALHQVMLNLLINAADALEGSKKPTIIIAMFTLDGFINILVKDNGCGMTEDQLNAAFKPFYTTKVKGTGLGLVLTKKMLVSMNSTIEVNSTKGVGTVVTMSIPAGKPNTQS